MQYLLSGFRFSTAVWVWLVVRMETRSPSGPFAVEITSYSAERRYSIDSSAVMVPDRLSVLWADRCRPTGGVVVWFLPVQDDEGRTSLHRHHSEVGRWAGWRRCDVHLTRFVFREVVEGGGDGARLIRLLPGLVNYMRRCRRERFN